MAYLDAERAQGPASAHGGGRHAAVGSWPVVGRNRPAHGDRLRWPLVADDVFRLVHRDHDGRLLLNGHIAGLGLAAGLLAELVLARRITLHTGQVVVIDFAPPVDALAHTVLDRLATEPTTHPVRTWLPFLAQTVYPDVAARLLRAGHLREDVTRSLLGRRVRYVPANMNTAAWPWARLSQRLRAGQPLDYVDTVLGGLVLATDLHRSVLLGTTAALEAGLRDAAAHAPAPIRDLLAHAEAAVGDAVIART